MSKLRFRTNGMVFVVLAGLLMAAAVLCLSTAANAGMVFAGSYDTPGNANDVFISGSYAYVADGASGLEIFDVSNPASPILTGSYDTSGNAAGVYVSGQYAYVADGFDGLEIINVSNPASPTLSGNYNTPGVANYVQVSGDYAYVSDGSTRKLLVINVSNPAVPSLTGSCNTSGVTQGIYVSGNYAYMASGLDGLDIIDVSNPAAPVLVSNYPVPGVVSLYVYVSGNYAYLYNSSSNVLVINVSDPANPSQTGSFGNSTVKYASASGNYAYVAGGVGSPMRIYDVSNPANPTVYTTVAFPNGTGFYAPILSGRYIYSAALNSGLYIYIKTPHQKAWNPASGSTVSSSSPTITLTTDENADCKWSLAAESYAAMAAGGAGRGDCTGDGTTSQSCAVSGLMFNIYIACRTASGDADDDRSLVRLTYTVAADYDPPVGGSVAYTDGLINTTTTNITLDQGTDIGSGIASVQLKRDVATLNKPSDSCGAFSGTWTNIGAQSPGDISATDATLASDNCYMYLYTVTDNAGNPTDFTSESVLKVDTTPPIQSAWSPASGSTIISTSQNISLTLNENGDCKWSLTDQAYADMAGNCTGDGTTSITCALTGFAEGANAFSIACRDTALNADTALTNTALNYTVVLNAPPVQSAHSPANGATIKTSSPVVTFITDENADCKWSLTDQDYGAMAGDCTGDGSTSQSCAVSGLTEGAVTIYFACRDTALAADTAASNTGLSLTFTKASYDAGLQYQFVYLCPPISPAQAATLGTVRRLINGHYQTIDPTVAGPCDGYVTSTNAPVTFKAEVPTSNQTHAITVGWNLIFNPFDTPLEYTGAHFSFKKTGEATSVSLDNCTDLSDFAVLGPGFGHRKVVPDDVPAIPKLSAFMIYSKATGELTITP